jgi:predicted DCC family thiol-disulfide oxidoreductase YuxK
LREADCNPNCGINVLFNQDSPIQLYRRNQNLTKLGRRIISLGMNGLGKVGGTTVIYDTECPVCTAYSCSIELAPEAGGVSLVSARGSSHDVKSAVASGFDLDDGMVVIHNGQYYHGADAIHILAVLAPKTGVRNRLHRLLFGSQRVARLVYPVLRAGRNLLLRILGKTKIKDGRVRTSDTSAVSSERREHPIK